MEIPINRVKKNLIKEDNGQILMSKENIKIINENEGLYEFPELNNKLYLHFKGFYKIENLEEYTNLATLWLENNGIAKIENLENQKMMHTLFLHNNGISKIENLEHCSQLKVLNLSHNMITVIENLSALTQLQSLDLSHNIINQFDGLKNLVQSQSVTNLDLSDNKFEYEEDIFNLFPQMANLSCLYMRNCQFSRNCSQYRRRMCHNNPKLKYLDDRPITLEERRLVEAWIKNGRDGEIAERKKIGEEKNQKTQLYLEGIKKTQAEQQEKRRKLFEKAQNDYREEIDVLVLRLDQAMKNGESAGRIRCYNEEIETLKEKIENLNFDSIKTDDHIRTQCFSSTRMKDGSVKIWNREDKEINEINEKYVNLDEEKDYYIKKDKEEAEKKQKNQQEYVETVFEQQMDQDMTQMDPDYINNVDQILNRKKGLPKLQWEQEFDDLLETMYDLYEEPNIVQIEINKFIKQAVNKIGNEFEVDFSQDYLKDKYDAILHRRQTIKNKSYQMLINQQQRVALDELD